MLHFETEKKKQGKSWKHRENSGNRLDLVCGNPDLPISTLPIHLSLSYHLSIPLTSSFSLSSHLSQFIYLRIDLPIYLVSLYVPFLLCYVRIK